jgi:hypothetical protein
MAAAIEAVKWEIVVREEVNHECALSLSPSHPLQPVKVTTAPAIPQNVEPIQQTPLDPLSALAAKVEVQLAADPLSSTSTARDEPAQEVLDDNEGVDESEDLHDEEGLWSGGEKFIPWAVRKTQIVQTFTTTGTIQMPSFVSSEVLLACLNFQANVHRMMFHASRLPKQDAAAIRCGLGWHPSKMQETMKSAW